MFITAPSEGSPAVVKVGFFNNYLPAEIEANVLQVIAERYPALGVSEVHLVGTDVTPAWVGVQRGDTDVLVEIALPNQQLLLERAAGTVVTRGQIYGEAGEGFFVPRYVLEGPGAPAPGLSRVDQLGSYPALFDSTLYDEAPGWQTTKDNAIRLKAYGIAFKQVALSDAALVAVVTRAADRRQPIVFFFSHPHWLFKRYDLKKLEEPNPYHDGCFVNGDGRCAVPTFSAWVGARKDLEAHAPVFYRMLSHLRISIDEIESMMLKITTEKQPVHDAAERWVDAHRADISQWVKLASGS
ncbi:MAG: glycine betaine ABC transporter substrate-binding protein [Steroidobacteraceae bacterium]